MQGGRGPGICTVDTGASERLEQVLTWTQSYCVSADDPRRHSGRLVS